MELASSIVLMGTRQLPLQIELQIPMISAYTVRFDDMFHYLCSSYLKVKTTVCRQSRDIMEVSSPLLVQLQRDDKKDNGNHKKRTVLSIILFVITMTVTAVLLRSKPSSSMTTPNKLLAIEPHDENVHVEPLSPLDIPMPSESELETYRSNIQTITYDMDEVEAYRSKIEPESNGLSELHPLSESMDKFHGDLMEQHEVDTDSNIQFHVNSDGQCATEYTFSMEAGFMQIECSDSNAVITGCTSYSPHSEGYRFGEGSESPSRCFAIPQSDGYTRLSARCCTGLTLSTETDYANSNTDFCLNAQCEDPLSEMVVGCSSHSHSPMTNQFAGVQADITGNGCNAQRNDDGYFWVLPYCVAKENVEECYTKQAEDTVFVEELGIYETRIGCDAGYEMTDCTSFVQQNPAVCVWGSADDGLWENHGAWLQGEDCVAHGTLQENVAQAVCCKFA